MLVAGRRPIAIVTVFGVSVGLVVIGLIRPWRSTPRTAPTIYREVLDGTPLPLRPGEYPPGSDVRDRAPQERPGSASGTDQGADAVLAVIDHALEAGLHDQVLDSYRKLVGDDATYALRLEILKRIAQLPVDAAHRLLLQVAALEDTSARGRQLVAHAGQLLAAVWASEASWITHGRDSLQTYRDRPRAQEALIVALRTVALSGTISMDPAAFEGDMRLVYERAQDEHVRSGIILSTAELWSVPPALAFLAEVVNGDWRSYTSVVTYPLAGIAGKQASRKQEVVDILFKLATRPEIGRGEFARVAETLDRLDPSSLVRLEADDTVRERGLEPIVAAVVAQRSSQGK